MNHQKKIAIILFNLGGPDKLSSVRPFLFNLFNDRAIINLPQPFRFLLASLISRRREKKSQKIYHQIGGKSPILDISESQAHALEKELSFFGDFKVFVSMRYWHPMSHEVIKNIFSYQPEQLILLPLYPQFSSTTTGSSFDDFVKKFSVEQKRRGTKIAVQKVCCYFEDPSFILAHSLLIKKTIAKFYDKLSDLRLLFSAHGLPQKLIDQGDPYVFQVEKTTQKIVENLQKELSCIENIRINSTKNELDSIKLDTKVCYQSKVGPLQWTGPSLENEIRRAALDKKIPVIIPIAFVSDHSETLVELDIDYYNLAKTLGIQDYLRVPALNTDGNFIKSLVSICKKVSSSEGEIFSSNDNGCQAKRACGSKFKMCCNKI